MEILLVIILMLIIGLFTMMLISNLSPKNKWFCRVLGWHKAPIKKGFDGCSKNGSCQRCGKYVLLDSQGNWF